MALSDRPVAILCGGKGTRLGLAEQKCVAEVAGRPFLHWKLDQLVERGATEFWLLVSHRAGDVVEACGARWQGRRVRYLFDPGKGITYAHRHASIRLPWVHWLTYGDSLLDVPLQHSLYPYVYVNEEFPDDAGVKYCWGAGFRHLRRHTTQLARHINTAQDMEVTSAYLRGHRQPR